MQSSMGGNKDRMKGRYNKVQVLDKSSQDLNRIPIHVMQ